MRQRQGSGQRYTWHVAVLILPFLATAALGECDRIPHYNVAKSAVIAGEGTVVTLSIALEDFAPRRLLCLTSALRRKYPVQKLTAYFFSSREAAKGFVPLGIDYSQKQVKYASKLHGSYFYDAREKQQYLFITPDGLTQRWDSPLNTRIDLPVTEAPRCRLAMYDRCLLELRHIVYFRKPGEPPLSGTATLTGFIAENGAVTDVQVAKVATSTEEGILRDASLSELATWRFESGRHRDPIRITFSYEVVDSKTLGEETRVQFFLPDRVVIQTSR
jgi:hypothetical protein